MKTAWSTWEQLSHMDSDACSGGGVERWKLKMLISEEEKSHCLLNKIDYKQPGQEQFCCSFLNLFSHHGSPTFR